MTRPILLIDGLNLFMRHFVVNPTRSESGDHVGGIVGFLKSLGHLCTRTMPCRVIVVWEGGGSPRRRAIDSGYKKGRRPIKLNRYYKGEIPDTVENRNSQIANLISIISNVPVTQIYVDDCEADDVIAYLVKNKIKDKRVVIASSDRDLYQLLSKNVVQWSPGQKKFITIKDVKSKYGISAVNFCTARCFVGDSSDGLKGVTLAGFASLSKRFKGLQEDSFLSVGDVVELSKSALLQSKIKLFNNIVEQRGLAEKNWKLMFLDIRNLSHDQINKIKFSFENPSINCNKLKTIKNISELGIKNFDIDSFFSSVSYLRG
jgi:DNA polymerase I